MIIRADSPIVLDMFCGGGGAAMGYHRAGFEVVGVDLYPQPDYPFEFIQDDAIEYAREFAYLFDAVHASPPCLAHTMLNKGQGMTDRHIDYIPAVRDLFKLFVQPTVIENVVSAPIRPDLMLCGEMFNLGVIRHRLFEVTNFPVWQPIHETHRGPVTEYGPYYPVYGTGGGKGSLKDWQQAMDIDWMNSKKPIAQAIPPAYTEFIGNMMLGKV